MREEYSHSGKANYVFSILSFFIILLVCFVITEAAALVGLWLRPAYAGIVLMIISCFLIRALQARVFKFTKNRNPNFAVLIVVVTGCITAFLHLSSIVSSVIVMGDSLQEINMQLGGSALKDITVGAIALFGWPTTVFRSFFGIGAEWVIYFFATFIFNIAVPLGAVEQAKQPFHEQFNCWMDKEYTGARLTMFTEDERESVIENLNREDIDILLKRPRLPVNEEADYSAVTFYKIEGIHTGYMGVDNFILKSPAKYQGEIGKYKKEEFIKPGLMSLTLVSTVEEVMNQSAVMGVSSLNEAPLQQKKTRSPYRSLKDKNSNNTAETELLETLKYTEAARSIEPLENKEEQTELPDEERTTKMVEEPENYKEQGFSINGFGEH